MSSMLMQMLKIEPYSIFLHDSTISGHHNLLLYSYFLNKTARSYKKVEPKQMCNCAFIKRLEIYKDQLVEQKCVRLWSGVLRFKSCGGQIKHSAASGLLPL